MTNALPPGVVCRIQLLGPPGIWTPVGHLSASKPFVFGAALYLGIQRGQPVSRATLASMLWPDVEGATRGERLRWLVAQLRQAGLPAPARTQELALGREQVVFDLDELDRGSSAADVLALARGDVLAGYEPAISDCYARWLDSARDARRSQVMHMLGLHLAAARREGRWAEAEELARRLIALDELHEDASLAMVEALTMQGRADRAAQLLARYRAESGHIEATPAVRRLHTRVRELGQSQVASPSRPPLVGREAVLGRLLDAIDPARRTSSCVALAGPSGIGKSRTLLEFATAAALRGTRVARIACTRGDTLRPISLVVDLARQLLEMRGALGAAPESIEVLHRLLGESARLMEEPVPEVRRAAVYTALHDLLGALVDDGPIVVIADDVQWAEAGSWAILAPLIGENARLTWTFGLRSDSAHLAAKVFRRMIGSADETRDDAEFLWLPTLAPGDVALLCARRAAPRQIPLEVMELLIARAAGIPFVAEALVQHWSETGELASLPPSVSRLVAARLERLSPDAQRALEALAVLGPHADGSGVEAVSLLDRRALLQAIRELDAVGILRSTDGLLSAHALWTEAVLSRVAPAALQMQHRYAAEWLEHLGGLSAVPDHRRQWAVAQHWLDAADPNRARRALEHAAQTLLVNGFVADAARMLERAAQVAGVSEAALLYWRRAAEMQFLDETIDVANELRRIQIPFERTARVLRGDRYTPHHEIEHCLVRVRCRSGAPADRLSAIIAFEECALAPDASTMHRLAAATKLLSAFPMGETSRGRMLRIWQVVHTLVRTGEREQLAFESYAALHHLRVTGDAERGLVHAKRARAIADGNLHEHQLEVHTVYSILALAHEYNGDLDDALQVQRESVEHGRQLNNPLIVIDALRGLVGTTLEAGYIAECRQLLPQLGPPRPGDNTTLGRSQMIAWVVCALEEGDIAGARQWLTVPLADTASMPGAMPRARILGIYAHIALLEGDDAELRRILPALLRCFAETDYYMDHPALIAGRALERLEGPEDAARFVDNYLRHLRPERWTPREELRRLAAGVPTLAGAH